MNPPSNNDSNPVLALDVTITAGPATGTRVRFDQPPAAFGRDPAHPLVIDLPIVSRDHGFFDFRDGKWVIVNRSPNGLKLNGKRLAGKKTRALPDAAEVAIGDQPVLLVRLRDVAASNPDTDDLDDADPMHRPRRRVTRTRLLIGLVGFWVVLFGVLFALEPMLNRNEDASRLATLPVPRLGAANIDAYIHAASPPQANDSRRAQDALEQAESFYALRDVKPDAAYRAMDAYRQAASFLPGNTLADPLAQRRFLDLQKQLAADMARRYADAMGKLDGKRYAAARKSFDDILTRFPDYGQGANSLHRHVQKLRDYARRHAQTKK